MTKKELLLKTLPSVFEKYSIAEIINTLAERGYCPPSVARECEGYCYYSAFSGTKTCWHDWLEEEYDKQKDS